MSQVLPGAKGRQQPTVVANLNVPFSQLLPSHHAGIYILTVSYCTRALLLLHRQARAQLHCISHVYCLGAEVSFDPAKLGLRFQ